MGKSFLLKSTPIPASSSLPIVPEQSLQYFLGKNCWSSAYTQHHRPLPVWNKESFNKIYLLLLEKWEAGTIIPTKSSLSSVSFHLDWNFGLNSLRGKIKGKDREEKTSPIGKEQTQTKTDRHTDTDTPSLKSSAAFPGTQGPTSSSRRALSHSFWPGACWVHRVMSWLMLSVTALWQKQNFFFFLKINSNFPYNALQAHQKYN